MSSSEEFSGSKDWNVEEVRSRIFKAKDTASDLLEKGLTSSPSKGSEK